MTIASTIARRLASLAASVLLLAVSAVQAQTVIYYHTDALGSPVALTDAAGNVIERTEYEPYGQVLTPPLKDGPGYTGHVSDTQTGLSYMQQRYYDPQIGRFLSMDPVTADANTGGNFNRYWYANNNPYKFKDPDGRESACFSTGKGTSCGASKPTAEDQAKFAEAIKTTAALVVPGAGAAACVSGGCGAGGWAAAGADLIPAGKVAGIAGKVGGALLKAFGRAEKTTSRVQEGTKVFRAFGENNNPMGQSWTTTDPRAVSNFRDAAGLPDVNTGRFVAEGRITDTTGVTMRDALPLDGNRGGLPEVLIPNAANQVRLERVSGVNPEF